MEMLDFKEEGNDPETLARRKKLFEEMYQKQAEERESQKKLKQLQDEQTKDPKELMLTIQARFSELYNGRLSCFIALKYREFNNVQPCGKTSQNLAIIIMRTQVEASIPCSKDSQN